MGTPQAERMGNAVRTARMESPFAFLAIHTPSASPKENRLISNKSAMSVAGGLNRNVSNSKRLCSRAHNHLTGISAQQLGAFRPSLFVGSSCLECGSLPPFFFQLDAERAEWMGNQETVGGIVMKDKKLGGRACKPDSVPHASQKRPARAAIIPLGHDSHRDSSSLPEGSNEPGRLFPPIWPCTTRGFPCPWCHHQGGGLLPHLFTLAKRCEHFEDVSQVSLCDATALHSAGGLFSVALSVAPRVAQALACAPRCAPWRYQARCPVKSSAPHKVKTAPQDVVRPLLPPPPLPLPNPH